MRKVFHSPGFLASLHIADYMKKAQELGCESMAEWRRIDGRALAAATVDVAAFDPPPPADDTHNTESERRALQLYKPVSGFSESRLAGQTSQKGKSPIKKYHNCLYSESFQSNDFLLFYLTKQFFL